MGYAGQANNTRRSAPSSVTYVEVWQIHRLDFTTTSPPNQPTQHLHRRHLLRRHPLPRLPEPIAEPGEERLPRRLELLALRVEPVGERGLVVRDPVDRQHGRVGGARVLLQPFLQPVDHRVEARVRLSMSKPRRLLEPRMALLEVMDEPLEATCGHQEGPYRGGATHRGGVS